MLLLAHHEPETEKGKAQRDYLLQEELGAAATGALEAVSLYRKVFVAEL